MRWLKGGKKETGVQRIKAAQARIDSRLHDIVVSIAPEVRPPDRPDAGSTIRFPLRHVIGVVQNVASRRHVELVTEGADVYAVIEDESGPVWLGNCVGEGDNASFETHVNQEQWLKALVSSGGILNELVRLRPALAASIAGAMGPQLDRALCEAAFAMLRRVHDHDAQPPLDWYGALSRAFGIDPSEADVAEFLGLWRQWRRDCGLDGRAPKVIAEEPLFTLGVIERSLGAQSDFQLRAESLPVDSVWDWYGLGGSGVVETDLAFVSEWSNQLLVNWALTPVTAFAFALSGE